MHGFTTPRRYHLGDLSSWMRRSALCGVALMAPRALHAQQGVPAQTPKDTSAVCTAMMNYFTQHPDAIQQMMRTAMTAASKPGDTVSLATRQGIVAAMTRRDFDSATALLRNGIPKGTEPQNAEAIGKMFQSLATISDSAQLARASTEMFITGGRELNMSAIQIVGALPDTLRNMLFVAAATSPNSMENCSMDMTPPPPHRQPNP
jgi:hypothetical protein